MRDEQQDNAADQSEADPDRMNDAVRDDLGPVVVPAQTRRVAVVGWHVLSSIMAIRPSEISPRRRQVSPICCGISPVQKDYSGLMLAAFMMGHHLSISAC